MLASMLRNLEDKTGKSLAQWVNVAKKSGLEKHGKLVTHLKTDHGLTHGYANLIARELLIGDKEPTDLVATQYSGAKAELKPIYDALVKAVQSFGKDVEIAPQKAYVSLRRKTQFGLIQPSTKTRIDVGIKLKGVKATGCLEESGTFSNMVTHRVRIEDRKSVNAELRRWLKQAYEAAG